MIGSSCSSDRIARPPPPPPPAARRPATDPYSRRHCECSDGLALALGQRLVVLHRLLRRGSSGGSGSTSPAPDVEFVSAVDAPERATALLWLASSSGGPPTGAARGAVEKDVGGAAA